ncbi:helix-turn-helix transcriptional regulator [Marinomonas algicola]|uniref:helix-turn-helix transcriptional regulator n=1 Tax=Marinomonas algicola TaxID=2773454 RepID=UPI0017480B4E|nr:YafY family protein [Marinomonas algicola]
MSRSQRLLTLIDLLRRYRYPISGKKLAEQLNISVRTLYRDIATLQEQGANIEGEAGLGYVLRPGFLLPPLMFTEDEIEALVLGARWAQTQTDNGLTESAKTALTKIGAILPTELKDLIDDSSLLVVPNKNTSKDSVDLSLVRQCIRDEKILSIHYLDLKGNQTQRRIWPFALGYFDEVRVLVAWCELRQESRHFRTDRLISCTAIDTRYATPRHALLKRWRATLTTPNGKAATADRN